jgi:Cellulase (glycosyl hydrolase family 5)
MDTKALRLVFVLVLLCGSLVGCATHSLSSSRSISPSLRAPSGGAVVSDRYFGMHVGFVDPGTPWPAVPFGTWRLWDANVTWKDLEPQKGVWDFSRLDALVDQAQEHNVDVILPLALTPQWASQRPNEASAYTPGAAAPPVNINDWIDYVKTVTARYKGRVAYYEMWNEMNVVATWTGTPADIVSLQQAAYTTIKSVDPNAQFISANLTTWGGLTLMQQLLDLSYANSADIIGYHFYVSPGTPEAIATLSSQVSSLLNQHGVTKPIWNTETGWLTGSTFANDDEAAAVAVRALLVAHSSGIERFLWYEWDNHCCVALFMTQTDNATPTRAALAYANLQKWLVGNTLKPCAADGDGTWSCDLVFSDGRHGLILWNPNGNVTVNRMLNWTPTAVEDMYGNASPASSAQLNIGPDPVLLRE